MDLNTILLWLVGISSLGLGMSIRRASQETGGARIQPWHWVLALVLGSTGACYWGARDYAGYVGFGIWLLLVIVPGRIFSRLPFLLRSGKFLQAYRWSQVASWLHPFGIWRMQPLVLRAWVLEQKGQYAQAETLLENLTRSQTLIAAPAKIHLLRMRGAWSELLALISPVPTDLAHLGLLVRAYGELGDAHSMLDVYRKYAPLSATPQYARAELWLYLAAFTGRVHLVRMILDKLLHAYPKDLRDLWQAIAWATSGQSKEAETLFATLANSTDGAIRRSAWLQKHKSMAPVILSATEQATLISIETHLSTVPSQSVLGQAPMTIALIGVNVAVFLAELPGGSTNLKNLFDLGGLLAPAPLGMDEWWRVFTAGFLHYGALHITMNALSLYWIGQYCERQVGSVRFAIAYLATGTFAMTYLRWMSPPPPTVVVGASGSVMGLIGLAAATFAVSFVRHRSLSAKRELMRLVTVVLIQTVFDLSTPEVSFTAHASGFVSGCLIGIMYALLPRTNERNRESPAIDMER